MESSLDIAVAFRKFVCQTSDSPLGLRVARAEGSTLWDTNGRPYLDLLAGMGVANIGYGHRAVRRAIAEQSERHLHIGVYGEMVQEAQVRLAQRLGELAPGDLSVTYFTNSGAEAVEGALKTARKYTRRAGIACFDGAYHGDTFGALSVCGNATYQRPFEPMLSAVTRLPWNREDALKQIDESIGAVIIEPIQAEGGVRIPSDGFLPALRRRCDEVGALLILDEVLTGFGRTGRLFAAEHFGIVPDLMVLAKALGGGLPLGAFIGRPEVMSTLSHDPPLAHVTTFGGHPLSCAAGLAALEVLLAEGLVERAARVGAEWLDRLRAIRHPDLREVRGKGMLFALELRDPEVTQRFARRCFENGVILNWTLHRDTVIRFAPPLVLTTDEMEHAQAVMFPHR